jgi:phosphoribosyl-ATP pyrophosphohydrolase/phosphoribosyl-AMP cyclohydrolase
MPVTENQSISSEDLFAAVTFNAQGLVPAIVQDAASGRVLMLAWMNAESLRRTLACGETVFWSRSRATFWHKGERSGNVQRVRSVQVDCDGDTLLLLVDAAGPACHTGAVSCFYRQHAAPSNPAAPTAAPTAKSQR